MTFSIMKKLPLLTLVCYSMHASDGSILQDIQLALPSLGIPAALSSVSTGGNGSSGIAISGTTAYVANQASNTLAVLDISNPSNISFVGTVFNGQLNGPYWVTVNGTTGYVTNLNSNAPLPPPNSNKLVVFDITNPLSPSIVGNTTLGFQCYSFQVVGTTGYALNANSNYIRVLDLTNPSVPTPIGTVNLPLIGGRYMTVNGNFGYVPHQFFPGTVSILQLSPGTATVVGSVSSGGNIPNFMEVKGTTGYVTNISSSTIGVINLTNPTAPVLLATVSANSPFAIGINGNFAYVSNNSAPLVNGYDISNPANPTLDLIPLTLSSGPSMFFDFAGPVGFVTSNNPGYLTAFTAPLPPYVWTGSNNNVWNQDGNWQAPGAPSLTDDVFLQTSGVPITLGSARAKNVYFNGSSSFTLQSGSLTLGGSLLQSSGSQTLSAPVTFASGGTVELLNGTLSIQTILSGATNPLKLKGTGYYNIKPSSVISNGDSSLTIDISSGQLLNDNAIIGSSTSLVSILGGSFTNQNNAILGLYESSAGGSLNISNGTFTSSGGSRIGKFSSGNGTLTIDNGIFTSSDSTIGWGPVSGTINLTINNGSFTGTNSSIIGYFQGSTKGSINIGGGSFSSNSSSISFAEDSAVVNLLINNTEFNNSNSSRIGFFRDSTKGSVTISGGTFTSYNSNIFNLAGTASVELLIENGVFNNFDNSNIGFFADASKGTITIKGGSFNNNTATMCLFAGGSRGTVSIQNGQFNLNGYSPLGFTDGTSSAVFDVSGGNFTLASPEAYLFKRNSYASQLLLNVNGGTFTAASGGFFGYNSNTITIQNGSISMQNGTFAAYTANSLAISNSAFIHTGTGALFGPAPLQMDGGTVRNDGLLLLDRVCLNASSNYSRLFSNSNLSLGVINGTGELWMAGTVSVSNSMAQGTVYVGQGMNVTFAPMSVSPQYVDASLILTGTMSANTIVTGSGFMYAKGAVVGDLEVKKFGQLTPGGLVDKTDIFKLYGDLLMGGNSTLRIDFDQNGNDQVIVYGGDVTLGNNPSNPILLLKADGPFSSPTEFPIITFGTSLKSERLGGIITGEFTIQGDQPLLSYELVQNSNGIFLVASANAFSTLPLTPNQMSVAHVLDSLNGHTNSCLQTKIKQMEIFTASELAALFDTLDPAEFKGQQIVFEEMSFIMNNELSHTLYRHQQGWKAFLSGGYQKLSQQSYSQYDGFSANAGYELLGASYGFDKWQIVGALGALETSTNYKTIPSHSSSASIIANVGASGFMKNWSFGLDSLFGYHFIHTSRKILPFNLQAVSNHGGYNLKVEAKGAYTHIWRDTKFMPYEQFGYNFTHENDFTEHGASCLDLSVDSSSRNMLRNTLGFRVETRVEKSLKRHIHIQPYLDASWVWENRFSGLSYNASFVQTSPTMHVQGINLTRNFGKLEAGLLGSGEFFTAKLSFNGMWGSRAYELGASLTLDRKF